MSILLLLSAAVTAPVPAPVVAAAALPAFSAEMPDLSAPPAPHAPMRLAPRLVPTQEEVMAATRPVSRSSRPRWRMSY